jgi:predicted alpha/beta superfamily hydrolase
MMQLKPLSLLLIAFVLCAPASYSQGLSFTQEVPRTVTTDLKSEAGHDYRLIITLPSGFDAKTEYKVLYYVDAWWLEDLVEGAYRLKDLSTQMDKVILVGISSVGNEPEWHRQRNRDLTPSAYSDSKMGVTMAAGDIPMNDSTTGFADEFMHFITDQVIGTVENEYKIDASSRGFLGHSFGGLFGFHALMKHPDVFTNYILLSPSVWWNKSELLDEFATMKTERVHCDGRKRIPDADECGQHIG